MMNFMLQEKKIVSWGTFIAVLLLFQTISFAAPSSLASKESTSSANLTRSSKVSETRQDYFKRYMKCYRENLRSSNFNRDMGKCMNGGGNKSGLSTFSSYKELETYLKNQYATRVRSYDDMRKDLAVDIMPSWPEFATTASGSASDGITSVSRADMSGDSYSTTNVQEMGVDEADAVKTDGLFFYLQAGQRVHIVAVTPPMQTVASIDLGEYGCVKELYLYKSVLVALYDSYTPFEKPNTDDRYGWRQNNVGVAFYDISNPATPKLIKIVEVEGYLVSSRRIENKLHIVQQFLPTMPPIMYFYNASAESKSAVIEENRQRVEELTIEELMPYYRVVYPTSENGRILPLVEPQKVYKPVDQEGGGQIATVTTFDLDQLNGSLDGVAMVANASSIYASAKALFILSNRWNDEEAVDSLSRQQTELYKFDLTGDTVKAVASGRVNGTILNQFSLGEYEDVLRVATTTSVWTNNQSKIFNHVYCLKENGAALDVIGKIEKLAFGERIYSARFIGKRGFLVTFVNVDPLFTLDLSNPTAPRVIGELKVPGYSDYIHPFGENHLIAIGKDAVFDGINTWVKGVQLSLFDVTQFENPQLWHKLIIGGRGTQSEANYNHKAFTFWPEHNLLAIPIDLYKVPDGAAPNTYGRYVLSGLYVYRVFPESGFEELGVLPVYDTGKNQGNYTPWIRGVFVNDSVYSITPAIIHSAVIEDIKRTIEALPLPMSQDEGEVVPYSVGLIGPQIRVSKTPVDPAQAVP